MNCQIEQFKDIKSASALLKMLLHHGRIEKCVNLDNKSNFGEINMEIFRIKNF